MVTVAAQSGAFCQLKLTTANKVCTGLPKASTMDPLSVEEPSGGEEEEDEDEKGGERQWSLEAQVQSH